MFDSYLFCLLFAVSLSVLHIIIAKNTFSVYEVVLQASINTCPVLFYTAAMASWFMSGLVIWLTPWWVWFPLLVVLEGYSILKLIKEQRKYYS